MNIEERLFERLRKTQQPWVRYECKANQVSFKFLFRINSFQDLIVSLTEGKKRHKRTLLLNIGDYFVTAGKEEGTLELFEPALEGSILTIERFDVKGSFIPNAQNATIITPPIHQIVPIVVSDWSGRDVIRALLIGIIVGVSIVNLLYYFLK